MIQNITFIMRCFLRKFANQSYQRELFYRTKPILNKDPCDVIQKWKKGAEKVL